MDLLITINEHVATVIKVGINTEIQLENVQSL